MFEPDDFADEMANCWEVYAILCVLFFSSKDFYSSMASLINSIGMNFLGSKIRNLSIDGGRKGERERWGVGSIKWKDDLKGRTAQAWQNF